MAERPSPVSLALCSLIALSLDPESPLKDVMRKKRQKNDVLHILQNAATVDASTKIPFRQLMQQVQIICGEQVLAIWMKVLDSATTSLDALMDLVMSLQQILNDGVMVDAQSQYGTFLRSNLLGWDNLPFEELTKLWKALKSNVDLSLGRGIAHSLDMQVDCWKLSSKQTQRILRDECVTLEEERDIFTEDDALELGIEDPFDLPETHFHSVLNSLKHGERVSAVQHVHRYVDYAMIAERKDQMSGASAIPGGRQVLHYAPVLLASAHKRFGEEALAEQATEEALRVAQNSGDAASIAYAMNLLADVPSSKDNQDRKEGILQQCAARATQARLRSLAASAHLSLAKEALYRGEVSLGWERCSDATSAVIPRSRQASTTISLDRPTLLEEVNAKSIVTACIESPMEIRKILSSQRKVACEIWEDLGKARMAGLMAKMDLTVTFENEMTKSERDALLERSPIFYGLSTAENGGVSRYRLALRHLLHKKHSSIEFPAAVLLHEWAVQRCDLDQAQVLLYFLKSSLHPRMQNYWEARVRVRFQEARLLHRKGDFSKAKTLLQSLTKEFKEGRRHKLWVDAMLHLAVIELDATGANGSFSGALSVLSTCLEVSEKYSIDSLHATTLSLMAQIQLRLDNTTRSIPMLLGCLPTLQQDGHVWFVAEALLTLAKSKLRQSMLQQERSGSNKTSAVPEDIVDYVSERLAQSVRCFRECDDRKKLQECYYLLARLWAHDEVKREKAASMFLEVEEVVKGDCHLDRLLSTNSFLDLAGYTAGLAGGASSMTM